MKIEVKVKINSKEQKITKITEDKYIIKLKSKPTDNKANTELIKLLKKHFKRDIRILRGKTSRNKIIEVKYAN
ncbi:MAG: DUF167 domain-containing protein [archaeon]